MGTSMIVGVVVSTMVCALAQKHATSNHAATTALRNITPRSRPLNMPAK
jgi:hypothetical protein